MLSGWLLKIVAERIFMFQEKKYFLTDHARDRLRQRQIEETWVFLVLIKGRSWITKGAETYQIPAELAKYYRIPLLHKLTVIVKGNRVITAYFEGVLSLKKYRALLQRGKRFCKKRKVSF
jgi:hypothetical protein